MKIFNFLDVLSAFAVAGSSLYAAGLSYTESDLEIPTLKKQVWRYATTYKFERLSDSYVPAPEDIVVTKYLVNTSDFDIKPVKYKVVFPQILYNGNSYGSSAMYYFNWVSSEEGVSLVRDSSAISNSDIVAAKLNNNRIINNLTLGDITDSFFCHSADWGAAVVNHKGSIGNITGNFIANRSHLYDTAGGAIYNNAGTIKDITGHFIANIAKAKNDETKPAAKSYGGAIDNNYGKINDIKGDFICNTVYASTTTSADTNNARAFGGAISNRDKGVIKSITGDFICNTNKVFSCNSGAVGGAISNDDAVIEKINGDFINNSAISSSSKDANNITSTSFGGAISNCGTIYDIVGDFVGNSSVSLHQSFGGAIDQSADGKAKISSIKGNFIRNSACTLSETSGFAWGGAINNHHGNEISKIEGNFIENYASSHTGRASGGAIQNGEFGGSRIGSISGAFVGNYAISDGDAHCDGGAIYAYYSSLTFINSRFLSNYASSKSGSAYGGAICADSADINFNITGGRVIVNSGNYAESNSSKSDYDGGFLYLRGSTANFNIEDGSKYIIGDGTAWYDSISGYSSTINKNGGGEMVVNSSMEYFTGTLNVNKGKLTVNNPIGASVVSIAKNATLSVSVGNDYKVFTSGAIDFTNNGTLIISATQNLFSWPYTFAVFLMENPEDISFGDVKTYGGTFDRATGKFTLSILRSIKINDTSTSVEIGKNGRIYARDADKRAVFMNFNTEGDVVVKSVCETTSTDSDFLDIMSSVDPEKLLLAKAYDFDVSALGENDSAFLSFDVGSGFDLSQFTIYHKKQGDEWRIADIENLSYDGEFLSFTVDGFSSYGFVAAVPEPSTYAVVFGALALAFVIYRKRR